jgi:hypothetical protein
VAISVTFPEEVLRVIEAICKEEHRPKAEVVRMPAISALEARRPRQALLFESDLGRKGKLILRLIRGGVDQS